METYNRMAGAEALHLHLEPRNEPCCSRLHQARPGPRVSDVLPLLELLDRRLSFQMVKQAYCALLLAYVCRGSWEGSGSSSHRPVGKYGDLALGKASECSVERLPSITSQYHARFSLAGVDSTSYSGVCVGALQVSETRLTARSRCATG